MSLRYSVAFPSFSLLSSLFLSVSPCCWPLGSTEQNWFPLFHGSPVRQRLHNSERERVRESECKYATDVFVHLYLCRCLSPWEIWFWLSLALITVVSELWLLAGTCKMCTVSSPWPVKDQLTRYINSVQHICKYIHANWKHPYHSSKVRFVDHVI